MGRNPISKLLVLGPTLVVGLGLFGCDGGPSNSPAALQAEKERMLAPTDTSKLTPEAKAKVDAIMRGNANRK